MAARLLIVDDHPVVRAGLKAFLEMQDDLEIAGEAGTLAEARAVLGSTELDLVLLDLQLTDGNGLELLDDVAGAPGAPRVVVLTSFLDEDEVRAAMRRGASGYLLKHAGPVALLDRVRAALRGELPLDPGAVAALARPSVDPFAELTPREREVLGAIGEGLSNRQIAERLGIREKTVKTHAGAVFAKLGVRDRVQAALLARDHDL